MALMESIGGGHPGSPPIHWMNYVWKWTLTTLVSTLVLGMTGPAQVTTITYVKEIKVGYSCSAYHYF